MAKKKNKSDTRVFQQYAEWTPTTSVHKTDLEARTSCILGIGGELNEYLELTFNPEMLEYTYRDSKSPDSELKEALQKEIGDVLYYLGLLANKFQFIKSIAITEPDEDESIENTGVALVFRIQEHYKKMIRDNHWQLDGYAKRAEFIKITNHLLSVIAREIKMNNWSLAFILDQNREKLMSRLQRGKIGGSGNER